MFYLFQAIDRTSIVNTRRTFDSVNVYLEFKSVDDVTLLKDIYRKHGPTVKKLEWTNWSEFAFNEQDFVELLNLMPNLEELKLSSWRVKFLGQEGMRNGLNLPKLKKLEVSDCDDFIIDILSKNLPENILEQLKIQGMSIPVESLRNFFNKQNSINYLDIEEGDAEVFRNLKLSHLRCVIIEDETPSSQRAFLKALIQSQPGLKSLDTLSERDFSFNFVNDEIFQDISNLQFLTSLKMNIDGVFSEAIQSIANLKNLRSFEVKTNQESSLETFKAFSLLKLPLENLILQLWGFEIPAQTYQQFGENFNLKSLKITLGTWHPVNFFIESFPKLESLSIRFGESNNTVELSKVFTGDEIKVHDNMKSLNLKFWGKENVDCEKLLKLLQSFPNLKKLKINSKFPFSAEFFNILATSLSEIKSLTITGICVNDDETFSPEVVDSLKALAKKLDYCHIMLQNVQDAFGGLCRGPMMMMMEPDAEPAFVEPEIVVPPPSNFSFEPLTVALKDHFKIKESNMSNIRIYNYLYLTIGKEAKE